VASNSQRDFWFPTTGILMPAFASLVALGALALKVGSRHGGHGGLGAFLAYAFGVVLIVGFVAQLLALPLALFAIARHPRLLSGFPGVFLIVSCLHVAAGSYYYFS
jgi:hypothetical protein